MNKKEKERQEQEQDRLFIETLEQAVADSPSNVRDLRRLLEKINTVLERYARPLKLFPEAARLRKAEEDLSAKIRSILEEVDQKKLRRFL